MLSEMLFGTVPCAGAGVSTVYETKALGADNRAQGGREPLGTQPALLCPFNEPYRDQNSEVARVAILEW